MPWRMSPPHPRGKGLRQVSKTVRRVLRTPPRLGFRHDHRRTIGHYPYGFRRGLRFPGVGDLVTQTSGTWAYITANSPARPAAPAPATLSVSQTVSSGAATATSYVEADFACSRAAGTGELSRSCPCKEPTT